MIKRSKPLARQNSTQKSRSPRQDEAPQRNETSARTRIPATSYLNPRAIGQARPAGEDCYRSLLETSPSVIIGLTPKCRIFEWNRAAERIYGWPREKVMGKDYLTTFLPKEIREAVSANMRKVLEGVPTPAYENEVIDRKGGRHTLLWTVTRIVVGTGKVRGILAVGNDITGRKRVEQEVQGTERFMLSILENIPHMIFVKDAHDLRFVQFNRAGEELLGYSRDELLGKNDYDFFSKAEARLFYEQGPGSPWEWKSR